MILFLVAFKTGYFYIHKEKGSKVTFINKSDEIFYDDYGYYLLKMVKHDNKEFIKKQEWFKQIENNISPYDLMEKWSYWGHKIKSIVTGSVDTNFLWTSMFCGLNRVVDDYRETFRYSMLIYPVFIFLQYVVLLFAFRKNLLLILFTLVVVDFVVLYPHDFIPSAYATLFFVTGLVFRFFYEGSREKRIIFSYSIMTAGSLVSMVCLPVLLVVFTIDIIMDLFYEKYHYIIKYVSNNFLKLFIFTLLLIFVLIWVKAAYNTLNSLNNPGMIYFYASKVLAHQNQFFFPGFIFSVIIFNYISSEIKDDKIIISMKLCILLSLLGPAFSYIISPLLPIVMKVSSFSRIIPYIYAIAMFGTFYSYQYLRRKQLGILQVRKDIKYILFGLLLFGFLTGYHHYNKYYYWKPKKYIGFSEKDRPILNKDVDGFQYYSANNSQQVILYFIEGNFKKHPLILENIETPSYSKKKVLKMLKTKSNLQPKQIPFTTRRHENSIK